MPTEFLSSWLDVLSTIAALVGIPVGIGVFIWEKQRELRLRQIEVFLQSNDRYIAYLDKVLEHPELECGEYRSDDDDVKRSGFSVPQLTLYTQLILVLEQAWYVYQKSGLAGWDDYWKNWEVAFTYWATRDDFRTAWGFLDPNVDSGFGAYMQRLIQVEQECQQRPTEVHA